MIWNVLRLIALIEASLILWFVGVVLLRYRWRYLQAAKAGTAGRRKNRLRPDTDWIGLLPLHVWLVTASTLLLVAAECGTVASKIGQTPVWYGTPLALVAFSLLLASLVTVAQYENRVTGR